ncbi:MAG: hypothetical protein NWF14_04605 [Candidatus Bathyarchaeota archaeon]|nr:hypothetical protein [Candidatus Bathyarchaeota archaeon]
MIKRFLEYCSERGIPTVGPTVFTKRLKDACPYVTVAKRKMPDWNKQHAVYDGIAFADEQGAPLHEKQKISGENLYNGRNESSNLQNIESEKFHAFRATEQDDHDGKRRNKDWMDKNRK